MGRKSKQYSEREQQQGRAFTCIVYPDSNDYDCEIVLNRVQFYWSKAYYILHDCDTYSENDIDEWQSKNPAEVCPFAVGEVKKPHYHIIGCSDAPCTLGRAATKFGIPSNYVQRVKSLKGSVRYLIHKDNSEKYQYERDNIQLINVDQKELNKFMRMEIDTMEKAQKLFNFIQCSERVSLTQVTKFSLENDCYDELRRGQHLYTSLIIEHNGGF